MITVEEYFSETHTFAKHSKTTCQAQEPYLLQIYFSNYSPGNITKSNFPLCKFNTVKAIWLKRHTILEHNKTSCHVQEP